MVRFRSLIGCVLALVFSLALVSVVRAARAQPFGIRLTRQSVSTSTDMALAFTTPTGVDSPSDSIEVVFPAGFDLSTLLASDLDLLYGPTTGEESTATVSATEGTGTWGATFLGDRLTLTPPTDASLGTIPTGSRVTIRIGTWAGGTHQIETPSEGRVYQLLLEGGFGDTATGFIIIDGLGGFGVSATVPSTSSSTPPVREPVGGDIRDTTPPSINNLRVESVTTTSAIVRWSTNEPATSLVEYRRVGSGPFLNVANAELRTDHGLLLVSLLPGTEYEVRASSSDSGGNSTVSASIFFTTAGTPAPLEVQEALVIINAEIVSVDDHQVTVRWTTNHPSLGELRLTASGADQTATDAVTSITHTLSISGLTPATSYAFTISASAAGQTATYQGRVTTTQDRTSPANVSQFRAQVARPQGVVLTWRNPPDADFQDVVITRFTSSGEVFVCRTGGEQCVEEVSGTVVGTLTYRAVAFDASGNGSSGAITSVLLNPQTMPTVPLVIEPPPAATSTGTIPRPIDGTVLPPILQPVVNATSSSQQAPLVLVPEFLLGGRVLSQPDASGVFSALRGQPLRVVLPVSDPAIQLAQAQVTTADGSIYQLAYREDLGAFVSDFVLGQGQEEATTLQVQAVAVDGRRFELTAPFRLRRLALVTDVSDPNRSSPVVGATVEAIDETTGAAVQSIQTDATGQYALLVPNGVYRLRVLKDGYGTVERRIRVESGILAEDAQLERLVSGAAVLIDPEKPVARTIAAIVTQAETALEQVTKVIRQPEIQAITQNVVAPVVVVATAGSLTAAATGFALFNYLRFLFTQPFLLIRRRKRQAWGTVYNALSKQPIELAVVRLLKAGTDLALQTRITDARGRFSFFVQPGSYVIQVQKPGYRYPTEYLKDQTIDGEVLDLYHGEMITVKEATVISPNIPIDGTLKEEETPASILRAERFRKAQSVFGVIGVLVGIVAVVIRPSYLMLGFALTQVVTYALFRRLAIPPAPKRWGIVYDSDGKRPLAKTVVRVFDKKFNKLLETQITSTNGSYGFFASKGTYYLTAEKPGYERYLSSDVDLTKANDTYIDRRFSLKRVSQSRA